jgi:hypothetical protein
MGMLLNNWREKMETSVKIKKINRMPFFLLEESTGVIDGYYSHIEYAKQAAVELAQRHTDSRWQVCEFLYYAGNDDRESNDMFYDEPHAQELLNQRFKKHDIKTDSSVLKQSNVRQVAI